MATYNKYELFSQGIYVDQTPSRDELINFLKQLHPVKLKSELIRIGDENDNSYLIPNDLDGIKTCFSPGVGHSSKFELFLQNKYGINSHLADLSVKGPKDGFIANTFTQKNIGCYDDSKTITMDSWVKQSLEYYQHNDFILQMDIEGGEYLSLLNISEEILKKFRILIIEIHKIESWGCRDFFEITSEFFKKILNQFVVVHNHPNNFCGICNINGINFPRVFELTLLRKDRYKILGAPGFSTEFPHPLDLPNNPNLPDIKLPKEWYGSN